MLRLEALYHHPDNMSCAHQYASYAFSFFSLLRVRVLACFSQRYSRFVLTAALSTRTVIHRHIVRPQFPKGSLLRTGLEVRL